MAKTTTNPSRLQLARHFARATEPKIVRVTISGGIDQAAAAIDKIPVPVGAEVPVSPGAHIVYWRVTGRGGTPYQVAIGGDVTWSRALTVPEGGEGLGFKRFSIP